MNRFLPHRTASRPSIGNVVLPLLAGILLAINTGCPSRPASSGNRNGELISHSSAGARGDGGRTSAPGDRVPTKPHDLPASDLGHDQASPSWTVRRVILLLPGGPQRIDFAAAIGRCDVEAAYAQAAEGLRNDFLALYGPEPLAWESLLQSPLLKSGWLGSVRPGSAITEMTSTRLDFNGNRHVDAMEFAAWLKNALAADPRFDLQESPRDEGAWENSPFGPLDLDGDHRLGQAELASGVERLPQFQPADAARLSLADFQGPPIGDSPDSMMNRTPQLLEVRSFLIVPPPLWELLQYCAGSTDSKPRVDRQGTMPGDVPSEKRGKEEVELAAARPKSTEDSPRERLKRLDVAQRREVISVLQLLLQQYSYADTISRAQVDDWDDEQWNGADRDGDASLDAGELIAWLVGPADHRIRIELSSVSPAAAVKDDDTFRGAEQAQAEEQDSSSSSEANTVLIPDHAPPPPYRSSSRHPLGYGRRSAITIQSTIGSATVESGSRADRRQAANRIGRRVGVGLRR
ncbi:MAG: hypothetical protein KatS3mg111_4246 [Pirellulaceae bacterium]|nr:MAG: hypothetical protein KatS3mg111_4246 [Pirellulaceae bacterium]